MTLLAIRVYMLARGCRIAIVSHGGAGGWREEKLKVALEHVKASVIEALKAYEATRDVVYAVVRAVKRLEDSIVLNAGLGSVPTLDGRVEMDAGVMSSEGLVGAVAATSYPKNPILLAYVVALETPHVLLAGSGADELARKWQLEKHPGLSDERLRDYVNIVDSARRGRWRLAKLYGIIGDTVGAVIAAHGSLAAATSTGGILGKLRGRVGDTPIPGAGFYATKRVACSATGIGETITLGQTCRLIDEFVETGLSLYEAASLAVTRHTMRFGPNTVGVIAVDHRGNAVAVLNTKAMPVAVYCDGRVEAHDCRV